VHVRAAVKALCVLDYLVVYGASASASTAYTSEDNGVGAIDLGLCTDLLFSAAASSNLAHVVAWHTRALHFVLSAGACLTVSPGHPVAGECHMCALNAFGRSCRQ